MTEHAAERPEMWWERLVAGWAAMAEEAAPEPGRRRPEHGDHHHHGRARGPRRSWRGPGFGPGFGPASGFGAGPGFGRGRRRSRAARGDVRIAVLALLAERPRHGYELIQEIGERSAGRWRPSPGSVYPTIAQLEDEGLARTEQTEGRRMVHLTDEGRGYCEEHAEDLAAAFTTATDADADADDPLVALRDVTGQVATAAAQVAQAGTEQQVALAREVLADTRRRLYRILAEDEGSAQS